jgi:xylulokinase
MDDDVSAVAAVDLGTESCRVALLRANGSLCGMATRTYPLHCPHPGWAEQRPDDWWEATCAAFRDVLTSSGVGADEIRAVAVAGQMHGVVPTDGAGHATAERALLWCDKRSAELCRSFAPDELRELERRAGNALVAAWMAPKIAWLRRHRSADLRDAQTILGAKDYLNARLTGVLATDPSEASGTFLFDAEEQRWSDALCDAFDIDADLLPPVLPSHAMVGTVGRDAARATGLQAGTPVAAGGGDMLCLLLGAGMTRPEVVVDVTGTAADVGVLSSRPIDDRRLLNLRHVIDGWVTFGILDAGGGSLRWLREVLEESAPGHDYGELSRRAGTSPPGANWLVFLPYLQGERTLGSAESRGVFFGLAPHHGQDDLVRAVMEGVAYDLRQTIEILRGHGHVIGEVIVTGGGAASDVWNQIKADVYQAEIVALHHNEGGIVGAAILAGLAAGWWHDPHEAAAVFVRPRSRFAPDTSRQARYERLYGVFEELHDGLQGPFDRLGRIRREASQA